MNEIKFQANWARTYIILGISFGMLFIIGALFLRDYAIFLNLLAAALIIYIGNGMLKRPYALYNEKEIRVFGHVGNLRKHYQFDSKNEVQIRSNAAYIKGEKLKISAWMIDKQDWQRFKQFYNIEDALIQELQDEN